MKATHLGFDPKSYHLFRVFVLFLLVISAGVSILRMACSAPSVSFSSSLARPSDTQSSNDFESLKTHISSDENRLHVNKEETGDRKSFSCSSLIDGRYLSGTKLLQRGTSTTSQGDDDDGLLCCDRSHYRTDVCYMRGDVRTDSRSSSILLYGSRGGNRTAMQTVRPYTRKWETGVMNTIDEIALRPTDGGGSACEVRHRVPAVVFSTGGYTGNVYHEFNDGMIPLYITAERFEGEVVLVVLEFHSWWKTKYGRVVQKLSNYKMVDFSHDGRVHCFPEVIVGLRIHGELSIDRNLMPSGKGIRDFQSVLSEGFSPNQPITRPSPQGPQQRPKLAIFVRNKSRVLQNLREIIRKCERVGFDVQILNPKRTTPLADIHAVLASADAMLAVHGAAMTHFLFLRPGAVLIQIVPLGLDWAAESYYGEPARRLGLSYMVYKVAPEESSLYREYDRSDPVLTDPKAVTSKGWSETKRVYLDRQNVRVNVRRFGRLITKAHAQITTRL